jgi:DegV family protein with EDD domain
MVDRVVVVTDSTSYLPRGWALAESIAVVPVQVIIAGHPYDETHDDQADVVSLALEQWQPVTTSRPSPERFLQAFAAAADSGATHVVAVTLSADMSATYESAVLAAKEAPLPVEVIDSRTIAMGLGFAAVAGARLAATGGSVLDVAEVIRRRSQSAQVTFYVDTMEYLRRGGRVSAARAAVGNALQVKPLLHIDDGRVAMLEKVRTASRALVRLADIAAECAGSQPVDIAVQHLAAGTRAAELAVGLRERLPLANVVECPVGGVVGAHVGPGMVAVVISVRDDA